MRKITIVTFTTASAIALACVSAPPSLSSFPARSGAVWSEDCCGKPIVQTKPTYPEAAARNGQDGWVVVSGIVDERGWVTDPVVLVSEPEGVFDAEALKAFDGWRYAAPRDSAKHEVREVITFRRSRSPGAPMGGAPSGGMGGGGGGMGY